LIEILRVVVDSFRAEKSLKAKELGVTPAFCRAL